MNDALPLLLLMWAASKAPTTTSSKPKSAAPRWPTPSSPPPMPAFQPKRTPTADPGGTSTPLAQLHNAPPKVTPASAIEPAKQTAKAMFKKNASSLLKKHLSTPSFFSSPKTGSVKVSRLQEVLNNRGAKLAPDGLYGPKTAAAWVKLAKAKGLPPTIARVGPSVAKVATETFQALSVYPIP